MGALEATLAILQLLQGFASVEPEIRGLIQIGVDIGASGMVTPEQERDIRARMDAVKAQVDLA